MSNRAIITASELHRSAGKALKRVAIDNVHLVVERDGYPVVVMVPYQEYQQLTREHKLSSEHKQKQDLETVGTNKN